MPYPTHYVIGIGAVNNVSRKTECPGYEDIAILVECVDETINRCLVVVMVADECLTSDVSHIVASDADLALLPRPCELGPEIPY